MKEALAPSHACAVPQCIHPVGYGKRLCAGHDAEWAFSLEAKRAWNTARYDTMLADFVRRMAMDFGGAVPKPHGPVNKAESAQP